MKDLSKEIVEQIKEKHIVPENKYRLLWKSYLFWFLMALMIILGAIFFSLIIFSFSDMDPNFFHYLKLARFLRVLFFTAPYLWIVLSLGALAFGVVAFRSTSKGYRYSALFVVTSLLLFVSVLGVAGHMLKINSQMDQMINQQAPGVHSMASPFGSRMSLPGEGLIGGEIIKVDLDNFALKSMRGENWVIYFGQNTKFGGNVQVIVGERVGVIGEKIDDYVMRAFFIHYLDLNHDDGPPPRVLHAPILDRMPIPDDSE